MEFINPAIQDYAEQHTSPEPDFLAALQRETHLKVLYPRMLSGHLQGRMLSMLSKLQRPKCILEIGTYTGYSGICLAEGLVEGGHLHTIDINAELEDMVIRYFELAGIKDKSTLHIGEGRMIIPQLDIQPDIVFIDADKENYSNYLDLVLPKMPSGGLVIADNILWSGDVLEKDTQDKETIALQKFAQKVSAHPDLEHILMPIRDGIMLARKK